jgi:hypothetical protein
MKEIFERFSDCFVKGKRLYGEMQWQRYDSKGEPNLTCRLCPDTNKLLDGSPILRACKILPTIAR